MQIKVNSELCEQLGKFEQTAACEQPRMFAVVSSVTRNASSFLLPSLSLALVRVRRLATATAARESRVSINICARSLAKRRNVLSVQCTMGRQGSGRDCGLDGGGGVFHSADKKQNI